MILRWNNNKDLSLCVGRNIFKIKLALSLPGAALAKGEQTAQPAIGRAVFRKTKQAWRVLKIETRADDQGLTRRCRRDMHAHGARQRVVVGDGDGREAERFCCIDKLLGVGAAAQKGEIGDGLKLGIGGRAACLSHHPKKPWRYQCGVSGPSPAP